MVATYRHMYMNIGYILCYLLTIVPGVLSWKSDLTSDEDLSGVIPMETGTGMSDWTKEPDNRSADQKSTQNWADFSKFSSGIRR